MRQKIIDAIVAILTEEYPDCPVYTERVEQGLKTPCFFAYQIGATIRRQIGKRISEKYSFAVQYLPASEEPRAECAEVEETLYCLLEDVTADGDVLHSDDITSETTDEVLTVYPSYSFFTREQEAAGDLMTDYRIEGDVS
ncbi:MAG: hypothetical protein IJK23_10195 [Clostridia bacterium]|nr:hypothetical protein [Clostridia bacterium]